MRLTSGWALLALSATLATAAQAQRPALLPLRPVRGLTFVGVTHDERGDEESFIAIDDVTRTEYTFDIYARIADPAHPGAHGRFDHERRVRFVDDSLAHRLNIITASNDPPIFPGSTVFTSKAMFAELMASGRTQAIVADVPPGGFTGLIAGILVGRRYYRGQLVRGRRSTLSVIVDGTPTALPVIEVTGHLAVAGQGDDVDALMLDNPAWPVDLKWTSQGRTSQITEIQRPTSGTERQRTVRRDLASLAGKSCRAQVYGIHFAFGSAELLPESDAALEAMAALLRAQPSWAVTIEGHTDNIGGKSANLDLSRRRAAAVRDALVGRFHVPPGRLTATGYGDTRPVAPNSTIEGRARNRRVELARKC